MANFQFKKNLKSKLIENKIKIQYLADQTGISRKTLENWLEGQKPRDIEQVKKVADFFKISVDELCFSDVSN